MTGDDFISIARQLLAGGTEAHFRTSVSRAYYGAFHVGRDFVRDCGIILPAGPEAHKNLRWCLANAGAQELDRAALELESLRSARNKADYDLADKRFVNVAHVELHVQRAEGIAAAVHASTVAAVASKMRTYAQKVNLPTSPP